MERANDQELHLHYSSRSLYYCVDLRYLLLSLLNFISRDLFLFPQQYLDQSLFIIILFSIELAILLFFPLFEILLLITLHNNEHELPPPSSGSSTSTTRKLNFKLGGFSVSVFVAAVISLLSPPQIFPYAYFLVVPAICLGNDDGIVNFFKKLHEVFVYALPVCSFRVLFLQLNSSTVAYFDEGPQPHGQVLRSNELAVVVAASGG